jgi:hypothetical protein
MLPSWAWANRELIRKAATELGHPVRDLSKLTWSELGRAYEKIARLKRPALEK